jgi:hypothetical protein
MVEIYKKELETFLKPKKIKNKNIISMHHLVLVK